MQPRQQLSGVRRAKGLHPPAVDPAADLTGQYHRDPATSTITGPQTPDPAQAPHPAQDPRSKILAGSKTTSQATTGTPGLEANRSVRLKSVVAGWVLRAGPSGVVGALDVPLGHLALDDPGCGPQPTCWAETVGQSTKCGVPDVVAGLGVVRGEKRPGGRRTGGRCAGRRRS